MGTIEESVREYYTGKIETHGASHWGADWNSTESQELRFAQLLKVCETAENFDLNDLGCGYAAMYEYLLARKPNAVYHGYDLCPEMIATAEKRLAQKPNLHLHVGAEMQLADYTVASGIFHVRLQTSKEDWFNYIVKTIAAMDKASRKGFAFNLLTSYSDADKMRDDLYYADPCFFFDHVKRKYARNVAVLHDYGLWEFTLIARKD